MEIFKSIVMGVGFDLINNLVQEGILTYKENKKIEEINNIISNFNERYADSDLSTKSFDKYLYNSSVEKSIFCFVFLRFKNIELSEIDFIEKLVNDTLTYFRNHSNYGPQVLDSLNGVLYSYYKDLLSSLYKVRESLLSLNEISLVSIISDNMEHIASKITSKTDIFEEFNSYEGKRKVFELVVTNSMRYFNYEIENSDNLILRTMNIDESLFAEIDIKYSTNLNFDTELRLYTTSLSPLHQCMIILDESRDKYLKRNSTNEKEAFTESDRTDNFLFKANGLILTAVGGMGKTVALIHLWKEIIKSYLRPVVYIQLNRVNELEDIENFIFESVIDVLFSYSYISNIQRHTQIELLKLLLKENVVSQKRLVLLLDGFNEIHPEKRIKIQSQIQYLIQSPYTLIILTTRPDLQFDLQFNEVAKCKIIPLDSMRIFNILKRNNMGDLNIKLNDLLSNVLMLALLLRICEWESYESEVSLINSKSELLEKFIKSLLHKNYLERRLHSDQLIMTFCMEYVVPYIGFDMAKRNDYKIKDRFELKKIISNFKDSTFKENNTYYEKYFQDLLINYLKEWNKITEHSFANFLANELITKSLLIQPADDGGYKFWHQEFRDYMASKYIFNELNCFVDLEYISDNINTEWTENILIYLKEIINASCNFDDYINRILSVLAFRENIDDIFIINLLRLALNDNNEISNLKFTGLDLSSISLNGVSMINVEFYRCKINWSLFERNDLNKKYLIQERSSEKYNTNNDINRIIYSKKNDEIYLLLTHGIFSLNISNGNHFRGQIIKYTSLSCVKYCQINADENEVLVTQENSLEIIPFNKHNKAKSIHNSVYFTDDNRSYTNKIIKAIYSTNQSKIIIQRESNRIEVINSNVETYNEEVNLNFYKHIFKGVISNDSNFYTSSFGDEFCITSNNLGFSKLYFHENASYYTPIMFDQDGKHILFFNKVLKNYFVMNTSDFNVVTLSNTFMENLNLFEFSRYGKYIIFVFNDIFVKIYSLDESKYTESIKFEEEKIIGVALIDEMKKLIVLTTTNRIYILNTISKCVVFSGVINKICFLDSIFKECDYTLAGTELIKDHLKLHGAEVI